MIENEADINVATKSGVTALTILATSHNISSINGQNNIIKKLIQQDADINSTLRWAKDHDQFEQVKNILVENNASINSFI